MKISKLSISLLLVSSCCALVILLSRFYIFPVRKFYFFLVWNLFLAWVPFGLSYLMSVVLRFRKESSKIRQIFLGILFLLWLIFFPNTFYILTDFIHLKVVKDISPLWLDFLLIGSFAWNGLLLGFYSLAFWQYAITKKWKKMAGRTFAFIVILLSSFGIYLGRILRWNSWDVFLHPFDLIFDIKDLILHPRANASAWFFCFVLAVILLLAYIVFLKITKIKSLEE